MSQTLSQTQIIRSLGEALEWFEKEISWGVSPSQLNHLTGRIGELYVAMITRGQMALATNQRGYDVVSLDGERISVKTITSSNHVTFAQSTFDIVDRVIIIRLTVDDDEVSIEEFWDTSAQEVRQRATDKAGKFTLGISSPTSNGPGRHRQVLPLGEQRKLTEIGSAEFEGYKIVQYENRTILIEKDGKPQQVARPILRAIAKKIRVDHLNGAGNPKNTRTLGADIIRALEII